MIIHDIFVLALLGCVALVVFAVGEYVRRKLGQGNEVSRKLVHMIHGAVVAVLPFLIGYWIVYVVEILFILSISEVYKLRWFRWMWRVGRKSWGEYFYPIGVMCAALLAHSKWIFLAGILELTFADAAAALVGKQFGRSLSYTVFKQVKSVPGSAAFFAVSTLILSLVTLYSPAHFAVAGLGMVLAMSVLLTAIENVGVYGLDNFLLPVATVALLNAL